MPVESGLQRAHSVAGRLARSRGVRLALIVLVGAVLRLWGILHGLADGLIYHADAHLAGFSAWHLYLGGPLRAARFGAAHGVLSWLAMEATDLAARGLGYPPQWSFGLIASVLACLTATLGILTIPAVYLLGARAFGRRAGLLAAAFLAVSPLHSFHSHYPYRDVPMVLALTLTLAACITLAARPGALVYAGTAAGAALTIALKPAGLLVTVPLVTALLLAWRRRRSLWVAIAAAVLLIVVLGAMSLFLTGHSFSAGVRDKLRFALVFILRRRQAFGQDVVRALLILRDWLGWPMLLAFGLGMALALWRRRLGDIILVAFLVPAFLAAAAIPWMDDRFFVYLVPPGVVLVARLLVGAADRAGARRLARIAVVLVTLGLLVGDLGRSAWQGMLLALPDTRALAGRWFEAHVPRTTRVAIEGYFPLGVNEWPQASFLEPRRPLAQALAAADVLVTSSLEHERYLDPRQTYPPALRAFFQALPETAPLMRTFALAPLGFAHPNIAVYATRPPRVVDAPTLLLPRPHDHSWNEGVAFLATSAYDRDDRTVLLSGAQDYDVVLTSPAPVDEVLVFVANGPAASQIRATLGWARRSQALAPAEWRVLHFRPRWWWPARPVLHRLKIALLPEGTSALVQVRAGPREIGVAYADWGRWDAAVGYLERAATGRPGDGEILLLLATAYRRLGRAEDARRLAARVAAEAPGYVQTVRQLGHELEAPGAWTPAFERATGLDAALLTAALAQEIRIEGLLTGGRLAGDPARPGEIAAVFERGVDQPGLVLNGPRSPRPLLYLEPGAYRARFTLRGGASAAGQPSAVLRVFAERRLLATRAVTSLDLGDGRRVVDVEVPFEHESLSTPVAVQVEATGRGSIAVDHVRIEPDLREIFHQRWRALAALGG